MFFLFISFITLMKATQNMLRYAFTPSSGTTDNELTQAKMIADAAAGTLKAKLTGLTAAQWNANDLGNLGAPANVRDFCVYIIPNGASPASASYLWTQSGGDNVLQLASSAAGTFIVELWYRHSMER